MAQLIFEFRIHSNLAGICYGNKISVPFEVLHRKMHFSHSYYIYLPKLALTRLYMLFIPDHPKYNGRMYNIGGKGDADNYKKIIEYATNNVVRNEREKKG